MQEISRVVTALGAVVASSGLVVYGMAASYTDPGGTDITIGIWLMILGVVATVAGLVMYRQSWSEED